MTPPRQLDAIGYLATSEINSTSYVGGLLIVNSNARPLEFHCTVPFLPSRSQRVLYGASLSGSLMTEDIPRALFKKAKHRPDVVFVNSMAMLAVQAELEQPVACIQVTSEAMGEEKERLGADCLNGEEVSGNQSQFEKASPLFGNKGSFGFAMDPKHEGKKELVNAGLQQISCHVDIHEPFERLKLALDETGKVSSHAA